MFLERKLFLNKKGQSTAEYRACSGLTTLKLDICVLSWVIPNFNAGN